MISKGYIISNANNSKDIFRQDPAFKRRFGSAAEKPPKKLRNLDLSWKEQNKRIR